MPNTTSQSGHEFIISLLALFPKCSLQASQSSSLKFVVVVVVVVVVLVVVAVLVVVTFCKSLKICLPYSSIIEGAIKCTVTVSKELVCTIIMHKYRTCT